MWNPLAVLRRSPPTPPPGFKYWAFISYSHKDAAWSNWLHRQLESFAIPPDAVSGLPPGTTRLYPVFQDREELPTASALDTNIEEALAASRHLIVICSPHAVASRWVSSEIEAFKRRGGEGRILALIVDGEPNASDDALASRLECFPAPLRYRYDSEGNRTDERVEPLAADVRKAGDGRRNALLKIVAGLLSADYGRLSDRDGRRRARRVAAFAAIGALALAAFAGQQYKAYRDLAVENAATQRALRQSQQRLGDSLLARGVMLESAGDLAGAKSTLAQAYAIQRAAGSSTLPTQLAYLSIQRSLPDPSLRQRMPKPVTALGVAADDCCAVTGHVDGFVRVTDLTTGEIRQAVSVSPRPIRSIDMLAAGGNVVIDDEGSAFFLDPAWRLERTLAPKQTGRLTATTLEPRRGLLAMASALPSSGDGETRITIFDVDTGRMSRSFRMKGAVSAMVFLRDGKSLVVADEVALEIILNEELDIGRRFVGKIGISDEITGHALVYKYTIDSMAVSADGQRLALGYNDGIFEDWDLEAGTQLRGFRLLTGSITGLRALPDGRSFVAATTNGTVHLIDEAHRGRGHAHDDRVVGAATTRDGETIVSAEPDWLVVARRPQIETPDPERPRPGPRVATWRWDHGDVGMMPTITFATDSRLFASVELLSKEIAIWHVASAQRLRTLKFESDVHSAHFIGPGELLVLFDDGRLITYDIVAQQQRRELRKAEPSGAFKGGFSVSRDRRSWALVSAKRLTIGDLAGGTRTFDLDAVSSSPIVRFSGDGKSIAVASDRTLIVLATADGGRLASFQAPPDDRFAALAISTNGSLLVTGHNDSRLRVWQNGSREPPRVMKGHTGGPSATLVLLDDDRTLISGGFNGDLRFWEIDGGSELYALEFGPPIKTLSASADGTIAAGVFGDRKVYGDVDLVLLNGAIGRTLIEAAQRPVAQGLSGAQRTERLVAIADTRRSQGQCADAIRLYEAARSEATRFTRLHDGLIDCLIREQRRERAADLLRELDVDGVPEGDRLAARIWLSDLLRWQ